MKSMTRRKTVWLGLVMTISLAACGGTTTSSTSQGKPFVVGAVLPLTGQFAGSGSGLLLGLQAAIAYVNKSGGVLGRQLTLVTRDSASDPSKGLLAANDLIDSAHPDFMIPDAVSTIALVVLPVTTTAKILTLTSGTSAALNSPSKYPYNFQMGVSTAQLVPALIAAARQLGGSSPKLGILSSTDAAGVQQAPLLENAAKAAGIPFVGTQMYSIGSPDLTVQVSKLKAAGATVVQCHCAGATDIATAMKGVQAIGWKDVVVVADLTVGGGSLLSDIPSDVQSQFRATVPRLTARSGSAAPTSPFVTAVTKLGQVQTLLVPVYTWDIVLAWKWAAQKAGSVNADAVKGALETLANTPDSQLPQELTVNLGFNPRFSPTQHGLGDANLTNYWALIQPSPLIDGTYVGTPLVLGG
jgi:branched-chain amino acid transport system substrate-binding protein